MVQRCGDEALKFRKDKASESMKHTKKELRRLMNEDSDRGQMATEIVRLRAELDKTKKSFTMPEWTVTSQKKLKLCSKPQRQSQNENSDRDQSISKNTSQRAAL